MAGSFGRRRKFLRFVEAITRGLRWKVIKSKVRKERPHFLGLLQEARNLAGHIQRPVSEGQVLQDMFDQYKDMVGRNESVDWARIKRLVLRSRPPCADKIDSLVLFLIKRSGGANGQFLRGSFGGVGGQVG